jgi:hypothetical protein
MKSYAKLSLLIFVFCSACSYLQPTPSPTETLKEYVKAVENKDAAGIKRTSSKKTIEMMEKFLEPGTTFEDSVKKAEPMPVWKNVEIRNEKINGDKATVETKGESSDKWVEVSFVKEEGRWKVAFAEMLDEMLGDFKQKTDSLDDSIKNSNKLDNK